MKRILRFDRTKTLAIATLLAAGCNGSNPAAGDASMNGVSVDSGGGATDASDAPDAGTPSIDAGDGGVTEATCIDATGAETDCGDRASCQFQADGSASCQCEPEYFGDACEYLVATVIPDFVDLQDPTEWALDAATGTRFRLATANERRVNGLMPGTFLVEASNTPSGFSSGGRNVQLLLPLTPTESRTVDMAWLAQDDEVGAFLEVRQAGANEARTLEKNPTFNIYGSSYRHDGSNYHLNGALLTAVAAAGERQFIAQGYVERTGTNGQRLDRVRISGPNRRLKLDTIGPVAEQPNELLVMTWSPGPQATQAIPEQPLDLCAGQTVDVDEPPMPADNPGHPCAEPGNGNNTPQGHQCDNLGDDDGDGKTDYDGYNSAEPDDMCLHHSGCAMSQGYPNHEHTYESGLEYGFFGDITWCTANRDTWKEDMYLRATFTNQMFANPPIGEDGTPNTGYDNYLTFSNGKMMRWTASKCWFLDSLDQAESCKDDASACGPFAPGSIHEYPYGGLSNPRVNYLGYRTASYKDLEHAVKLPEPNRIRRPLDLWQVITREVAQGHFGKDDTEWGGTAQLAEHAGVINGGRAELGYALPYSPSAHEFGHVFGCEHEDVEFVDKVTPLGNLTKGWSLMATGANKALGPIRAMRFGKKCSLRMVDAATELNKFNRRSGATSGPIFGY